MRVRRAQARLCGQDARATGKPNPFSCPVILALYTVIPAKAGIQTIAAKPAIRNQV